MNAKKIATLIGLGLALASPALADYLIATPTVQPVKAGVVTTGAILNLFSPVDATGAAFGVSNNPFYIAPLNGNMSVTQATIPWVTNINSWDGVGLGPPSAYGTAPSGNVIGVNANVTNPLTTGPALITNTVPTNFISQYPVNSVTVAPTPVGGVATGTTAAVSATMAATAGVTNFLCELDVSYVGGTAAGQITITGLNGGTRTYNILASTTPGLFQKNFSPCIPASAANVAINVVSPALAGATANDVNLSGYRL